MVARVLKIWASNCLPWSVVICCGQPKRATQTETKALATASAVLSDSGSLRPTGVSVDGSETVPETRRNRQRPEQVDMHMWETCRREVETPERGLHVPRYLGLLAGCTRACPWAAVFPHSRPHKPLGQQLDGGVGPGVAKVVEGVKDLASEKCGYEWPRLWSGCVTVKVEARLSYVHPF